MSRSLETSAPAFRLIHPGDPAPRFVQASTSRDRYALDAAGGRYLLLAFFGTTDDETARNALDAVQSRRALFDDARLAFFGVSVNPADQTRVGADLPGLRWFWDFDRSVSRLYGAAPLNQDDGAFRRLWVLIDPMLRVQTVIPFAPDSADLAQLLATLDGLPSLQDWAGDVIRAPVLYLPNVFEPELCQDLIAAYDAGEGELSGVMKEREGRTVMVMDAGHKRRRDVILTDQPLIERAQARVRQRILPEIRRAYQFEATRIERHLVACYADEDGGHFRAHRDNTTKGTAHRRFAVSINLSDDFEGGEIGFPEFGPHTYKPPPGGAVVFSCSLLHQVSPVTRGRRYAYLPFLYDEAAAAVREANSAFLGDSIPAYRA